MKNSNDNLWAPWRMEYLKSLSQSDDAHHGPSVSATDSHNEKPAGDDQDSCFLCRYAGDDPDNDKQNLLLWRGRRAIVVFNRYPYTAGHLLIGPISHVADLADLDEATILEMMSLARDGQKVLTETIHPHGFNIGINIGRCAGAGLPGHIHIHLIPRWDGDTNSMSVIGRVRVISQSLDELYDQLAQTSKKLDLPTG